MRSGALPRGDRNRGRGAKAAVAGIAAAALLFGVFGLPLLNPGLEGMKPVMSLVSTGIGGPAQIRCQKILLIAGTPDAETAEFCACLLRFSRRTRGFRVKSAASTTRFRSTIICASCRSWFRA